MMSHMGVQLPLPLYDMVSDCYAFQRRDGTWEARICAGWWMATGDTKEKAIRRVIKRYRDEQEI